LENLLIPYQATSFIPSNKVLVIAPHPDDEVFGCGGAIMRHVEQGTPVHVIVVSDGSYGVLAEERANYTLQRQRECEAAAKVLGYESLVFWSYLDREVCYSEKLVQEILTAINEAKVDLIYAPSVWEMHPDHRAVGMAAVEAVRRKGKAIQLALYEVGIPLRPNRLLDISDLAERKMMAMQCFVSQNEKQRYDLDIAALNRYRTYTLPAEVTAAEAYFLVVAEELANDPLKLYQSEHMRQKELGLVLDSRDRPLVSVIIRSMDRPTLLKALDSIALQTYSNIEIVVVNAKGIGHHKMDEWCGRFPLRLISDVESLARSRAANVGLEAAKGNYLIFLDDDDWLHPQHIARLVGMLQEHPEAILAYAGVECLRGEPAQRTHVFDAAFSRARLFTENYIPIHAALFAYRAWEQGCRFDESFDLHEDWDFWLQLLQLGEFVHCPGVSASYRIDDLGSGIWTNQQRIEASVQRILEKWWHCLDAQIVLANLQSLREDLHHSRVELDNFHQRATTQEEALSHALSESKVYADALREHLNSKELELKIAHEHLHSIHEQLNSRELELKSAHEYLHNKELELKAAHTELALLQRFTLRHVMRRVLGRH
jgi:LmbE family N-acetylglucosaminyl deacetylase/glycosyltransferase involved in cell wall biosynthesis